MVCPKCKAEGWIPYSGPTQPGLRWCPVQKAWMQRSGSVSIQDLKVVGVIRQDGTDR